MSMNPNDPFQQDPNQVQMQGQMQGQVPGRPPTRSGRGCLLGCGAAAILMVFVCCGGSVLLTRFGVGVIGAEFERQLAGDPVIEEQIGEIESMDWSFSGTIQEAQNAERQGGQTPLVFDVEGSKGDGQIVVVQDRGSGDGIGMESATLITSDGTRIPLNVGFDDEAEFELEMDLEGLIDEGDVDATDTDESTGTEESTDASTNE